MQQLERLGNAGPRMAQTVRAALSNPGVAMEGSAPFDGYLAVCRNSDMHWGVVRAVQHLRDVITVSYERYFTDRNKFFIQWKLRLDKITPMMLKLVEKCLQDVDGGVLEAHASNRWLGGIHGTLVQIKAGAFQIPTRPEAGRIPSQPDPPSLRGQAEAPTGPAAAATVDLEQDPRGLRALRQQLLPQYLDLAPEDFAALCRMDQEARDFAQGMGAAIERFSIHCLSAARQKYLKCWTARTPAADPPAEEIAIETGKCVLRLAEEAASFRDELQRELPQAEDSIGRRLMLLAESSLIAGLFFLFLQQRFAGLFSADDDNGDDSRRRGEAQSRAARRMEIVRGIEASLNDPRSAFPALARNGELPSAVLDAVKYCADAMAALVPLLALPIPSKKQGAEESSSSIGKIAQRFLSAECIHGDGPNALSDYLELVEHEPGMFPPLRCRHVQLAAGHGAAREEVQVCRFSRMGGVALSPDIAIPVPVLFGEESRMARVAAFFDSEAKRHVAQWRRLTRDRRVRKCLPYFENHGAPLARIHIRGGDSAAHVTLLALPTAALPMSGDFSGSVTMPEALEQASARRRKRASARR
jgi:hypothetical protein